MRVLLLTLSAPVPPLLLAYIAAQPGAMVESCQSVDAAMTLVRERVFDLIVIEGRGAGPFDAATRLRSVSHHLPMVAVLHSDGSAESAPVLIAPQDVVGFCGIVISPEAAHDRFHKAGAMECLPPNADAQRLRRAVERAAHRARLELDLDTARARERRLRGLIDQIPVPVLLVSPEDEIQAANLSAMQELGAQDARQILGSPLGVWLELEAGGGPIEGVHRLVGNDADPIALPRQVQATRRLRVHTSLHQREDEMRPSTLVVLQDAPAPVPVPEPEPLVVEEIASDPAVVPLAAAMPEPAPEPEPETTPAPEPVAAVPVGAMLAPPPDVPWAWMPDVAGVGVVTVDADGRVTDVNAHALALLGCVSADDLLGQAIPAPLALSAGSASPDPTQFEACWLRPHAAAPIRVTGVRTMMPETGATCWLFADRTTPAGVAAVERERHTALVDLLEAALADGTPAHPLLTQLAALARHESAPGVHDIGTVAESLRPVLTRLVADEIAWSLEGPADPLHVCARLRELERGLIAVFSAVRETLPIGGSLRMSVGPSSTPAEGGRPRRAEIAVCFDAQGYGVTDFTLPADLAARLDALEARVASCRIDARTSRTQLVLPRAFVTTLAARPAPTPEPQSVGVR